MGSDTAVVVVGGLTVRKTDVLSGGRDDPRSERRQPKGGRNRDR
jgi:hypothetical protein